LYGVEEGVEVKVAVGVWVVVEEGVCVGNCIRKSSIPDV
jgi:hypothetical protein